MSYGKFSTYEEVATKFEIKLVEKRFMQEKSFSIDSVLFGFVRENLDIKRNYVSENAICESIIAPILHIVARQHKLPVWSHMRFDLSENEGLVGIPDFIIAPATDIGTTFKNPVICVAEAKKENFNEGWAQALSEMIAAQRFNQDEKGEIFGIVTNGAIWQFGKLCGNELTMEVVSYSAAEDLQNLFNILNWMFIEAKKNLQ